MHFLQCRSLTGYTALLAFCCQNAFAYEQLLVWSGRHPWWGPAFPQHGSNLLEYEVSDACHKVSKLIGGLLEAVAIWNGPNSGPDVISVAFYESTDCGRTSLLSPMGKVKPMFIITLDRNNLPGLHIFNLLKYGFNLEPKSFKSIDINDPQVQADILNGVDTTMLANTVLIYDWLGERWRQPVTNAVQTKTPGVYENLTSRGQRTLYARGEAEKILLNNVFTEFQSKRIADIAERIQARLDNPDKTEDQISHMHRYSRPAPGLPRRGRGRPSNASRQELRNFLDRKAEPESEEQISRRGGSSTRRGSRGRRLLIEPEEDEEETPISAGGLNVNPAASVFGNAYTYGSNSQDYYRLMNLQPSPGNNVLRNLWEPYVKQTGPSPLEAAIQQAYPRSDPLPEMRDYFPDLSGPASGSRVGDKTNTVDKDFGAAQGLEHLLSSQSTNRANSVDDDDDFDPNNDNFLDRFEEGRKQFKGNKL